MSFAQLGLSPSLIKALAEQHYLAPFPIQEQAIPAVLEGKDVLGIAKTGSGKTAGYVLPILEASQKAAKKANRHARVLVLVPTRELAIQVADAFLLLGRYLANPPKSMAVYGGVSINPQMMKLQGIDILVATPGRLLDLIDSNAVHLSEVELLVLDEADKMLNLGFKDEMTKIFSLLPAKRQNILFSATLDSDINNINAILLRDPLTIEIIEEEDSIELIEQSAYAIEEAWKGPLLRYLIKSEDLQQVLVFTSAIRSADNLVVKLVKNGIAAAAFHGDKSQGSRTDSLTKFKSGKLRVLVATDLAGRGIDIPELPVVINYELPRSPKDYIHRIGRTGRAGNSGKAISLVTPADEHHFKVIQKKTGQHVALTDGNVLEIKGS